MNGRFLSPVLSISFGRRGPSNAQLFMVCLSRSEIACPPRGRASVSIVVFLPLGFVSDHNRYERNEKNRKTYLPIGLSIAAERNAVILVRLRLSASRRCGGCVPIACAPHRAVWVNYSAIILRHDR